MEIHETHSLDLKRPRFPGMAPIIQKCESDSIWCFFPLFSWGQEGLWVGATSPEGNWNDAKLRAKELARERKAPTTSSWEIGKQPHRYLLEKQ